MKGSAKNKINLRNFDVHDIHIRIYVNKRKNPRLMYFKYDSGKFHALLFTMKEK